jgi:hypothetical protein
MAEPHPFRRAAEAKDIELMRETLRDDVVLHSPVLFRGFEGREAVGMVLSHVAGVLEDFTYVDEAVGEGTIVLRFKAMVGDKELEGSTTWPSTRTAASPTSPSSCDRCRRSPPSTRRWPSASASSCPATRIACCIRGSVRVVKGDWL